MRALAELRETYGLVSLPRPARPHRPGRRPRVVQAPDVSAFRRRSALAVRLVTGLVFVVFGIGKFTAHASEVRSFRSYGFPWPDLVVYATGVLEVVGGVLLIAGVLVRLVALALAGNMIGAITTSGIQHGETVSLTLAPAMLAGMVFLLWAGPSAARRGTSSSTSASRPWPRRPRA